MFEQSDEAGLPIAVHGMTCTPVAHVWRGSLGRPGFELGAAHGRPSHVDVVHADGRREVVPIHNTSQLIVLAIPTVLIGLLVIARSRTRRT